MNSIEQFWKKDTVQKTELNSKQSISVNENVKLNTSHADSFYNVSNLDSKQVKDEIWKLLVDKGEPLEIVTDNLEDRIKDDDSEVIYIIQRYHKTKDVEICTNDGIVDEFMLNNIDRIRNWDSATVKIGKENYLFTQSPIMQEILFNTAFGTYELEAIAEDDDIADSQLKVLLDKYFES